MNFHSILMNLIFFFSDPFKDLATSQKNKKIISLMSRVRGDIILIVGTLKYRDILFTQLLHNHCTTMLMWNRDR